MWKIDGELEFTRETAVETSIYPARFPISEMFGTLDTNNETV